MTRHPRVEIPAFADPARTPLTTRAGALLPTEIDGALVVAAEVDHRPVSLDTPVRGDARLEPVTVATWEGRRIFRASVGLLLLEAARTIDPAVHLALGPRRADAQLVLTTGVQPGAAWIAALEARMVELARSGTRLHEELWPVGEARAKLMAQGWTDAAGLLAFERETTVPLSVCGGTYALATGPLVPDAGALLGFSLLPHADGILLRFGAALEPRLSTRTSWLVAHTASARTGPPLLMGDELRAWQAAMDVANVGAIDRAVVDGRMNELVDVAEGFHEKHIGRIADRATAERKVRVVAIAGPSSSGKTTFIRRLKVQLEVNGVVPVHLSLDDYYVDREKTPRDDTGDWDFESPRALDLDRLGEDLRRLAAGERVRTPRFDFPSGKSIADGGPELVIGRDNVLLLEGLHALSPLVYVHAGAPETQLRVFVHPATAIALDRLSSVLPEDLRLIRRIVRDRHHRGWSAKASIARWPAVRRGEEQHVYSTLENADIVFDSSLVYELSVLRVYAERDLLEIPEEDPAFLTAFRLRRLLDRFVPIYPDRVPPSSLLREFIG